MISTNATTDPAVYKRGCWTKFNEDVVDENQDAILYSGIAIVVIMVRFKYLTQVDYNIHMS